MNLELVENIVTLIGEYPVSEIEVTRDGQRVSVRRPLVSALPVIPGVAADGPETAAENMLSENMLSENTLSKNTLSENRDRFTEPASLEEPEAWTLTALMVGIFHHTDPPLPYAAEVRPGQVVGYIESMKLMNDVVADEGGQIIDVLVEDAAPVEYGQPLFRLGAASPPKSD